MVHVCVGFYSNGDYVVNMVDDKDLADNIEYNSTFRPGRSHTTEVRRKKLVLVLA